MLVGRTIELRELERNQLYQLFKWNEEKELYLFKGRYKLVSYDEFKENFLNYTFSQQILLIKNNNMPVGVCSYWDVDWKNRYCAIYAEIYEKEKNMYLKETISILTRFLFDHENLFRIYADVPEEDRGMIRTLESFGFILEGVLREHDIDGGHYKNTLKYGQLKNEYVNHRSTDQ